MTCSLNGILGMKLAAFQGEQKAQEVSKKKVTERLDSV